MNYILISIGLLACTSLAYAQHTFSIAAVDPTTGGIGSAGATCLDSIMLGGEEGALVISDVIPGRGVIHTQAEWIPHNQLAARERMLAGDSPQAIIDWLVDNDSGMDGKTVDHRQYGIVDFHQQQIRTAAYTGKTTVPHTGHLVGETYTIQGNMLKDSRVLMDMEAAFVSTPAPLSDRLMAAMQAAKRPGADFRCEEHGVSSLSAFVRLALPDERDADFGKLRLDINVSFTPEGVDPIDNLQVQYDAWKAAHQPHGRTSDSWLIIRQVENLSPYKPTIFLS